jgi:hypothetical protein
VLALFASPATESRAAATTLFVSQTCSASIPGTIAVSFSWLGGDPAAIQQWLDLSLFNNDWQPDSFLGAGPFAASASAFSWDGLLPDAVHYVRISEQYADGSWGASPTFTFQTPAACNFAAAPAGQPASGAQAQPPAAATTRAPTIQEIVAGSTVATSGGVISIAVSTSGDIVITTAPGFMPFP